MNNLQPDHLKDLHRSGLSKETIEGSGIKTVPPHSISERIGFTIAGLTSAYEIPYDDEYSRFKVFYAPGQESNSDGSRKPKYLARRNSGNRLYIPQKPRIVLNDVKTDFYFTEGEKKALAACQAGLACVGLPGLWNWSDGRKELIKDFEQITLKGRNVFIVPDNDWQEPNIQGERKNLKDAVYEFAFRLIDKEAKVFIIELPPEVS